MFESSTENYTVGKGQAYFDRKDENGAYEGERNIGNVVSLSTSVEMEKLDHYSTKRKYRLKDKSVVIEVNPKLSLTLDEINAENFALLFLADVQEVEQTASTSDETMTIEAAKVKPGYVIDLGKCFIDETTFGVSGAGGTDFASGTDYLLDARCGKLQIYGNGSIDGSEDLEITYRLASAKYKKLSNFQRSNIEGRFTYVSENAAGNNFIIKFWSASFTPTGDTVLITDSAEWMNIQLEGEIQADENGHPESPFGETIVIEKGQ